MRPRWLRPLWYLVPGAAVQDAARTTLHRTVPLLEEEWHAGAQALIKDLADPVRIHWSRARTGFPADDHPIDAAEIQLREWTEQGLSDRSFTSAPVRRRWSMRNV